MYYSIAEIKNILQSLQFIFDTVRLVDPINGFVISFDKDDVVLKSEYFCYQVWAKQKRCQNCISLKALTQQKRFTKYEFVNDEIYHVVSKPVSFKDNNNCIFNCCLEIVTKISDEVLFEAFGEGELINRIIESERKIYLDSLTQAYNRRYFDEKLFYTPKNHEHSQEVVFVVIDLYNFKSINDNYGHQTGDFVLKQAGQAIMSCVRKTDAVIRLGGDEFLIILFNCSASAAKRIIHKIKNKFSHIIYDTQNNLHVIGNFGLSHANSFQPDPEFIQKMFQTADLKMYEDKHKF